MSWPINEVAKLSELTSRTLRHYQAIGPLEPKSVEFSDRRLYGQGELRSACACLPLKSIVRIVEE